MSDSVPAMGYSVPGSGCSSSESVALPFLPRSQLQVLGRKRLALEVWSRRLLFGNHLWNTKWFLRPVLGAGAGWSDEQNSYGLCHA